jgi:hypothetical protein
VLYFNSEPKIEKQLLSLPHPGPLPKERGKRSALWFETKESSSIIAGCKSIAQLEANAGAVEMV